MLRSMNKHKKVIFSHEQEVSAKLSQQMNEPLWFSELRKEALVQSDKLEAPEIERADYSAWELWNIPNSEDLPSTLSKSAAPTEKIWVVDFTEAYSKDENLFKECYEQANFQEFKDLQQAYTMAFLTDSLFIYIPENCHVDEPIELTFKNKKTVTNRQVLIYAAGNSSAHIIERYETDETGVDKSANIDLRIVAKNGAHVHYASLDQFAKSTTAYVRRTAKLQKDATVNWALGSMNDGFVIEDIQVDLEGPGSTSDVKTAAISNQQQTQIINVNVTNIGRHSIGNIFQHGVALDQATLTFNGIGRIVKDAKDSDAQQESRILMLSDEARADANPILLIDEYELTAGHAASVSRVDQEQLYYLMSRGLEQIHAEKLVIRGFLGILLSEISIPEVREELTDTIERKLAQYGNQLA